MPLYKRHYSPGQLQFITTSTYRRAPLFLSECFPRCFVETLAHLRPFNVYSEKKRLEKLDHMHQNPVKRGLVKSPGEWAWSSWRFYFLHDASILARDRLE